MCAGEVGWLTGFIVIKRIFEFSAVSIVRTLSR
jgi:hypothetical protein